MKSELKLIAYTPEMIAAVTGGEVIVCGSGSVGAVTNICTDSREACEGSLFCAIPGEKTDGHMYIRQVCEVGASCILAEYVPETVKNECNCTIVQVKQTISAIGDLAADYRSHSHGKVVAVTGSVGKTTTKEFIYSVAAAGFRTHKTEGNHNNELGLSMMLFRLQPEDEISVLEMGMSDFGEIERMSKIARPDLAVVTNIGTSHLASLGTRENICSAKLEIVAGMSSGGTVLLNADEPLLYERASVLPCAVQLMSIGNSYGDYRAVNIRSTKTGMVFDMICHQQVITNLEIPTLGKHNVYNALCAYAVGYLLGLSEDVIRRGLMNFQGAAMRQKIYKLNGITIIEDCYNASPESMNAALDVLASVAAREHGRAAALLGDMLELGDYTRLMHDQLGQYAAQTKVNKLFCYGMMADVVAEAAIKHGIRADNVYVSLNTKDPQTMADMILSALVPGDVLLVKASRAVAAENVIEAMKRRCKKKNRG